ncbi:MAG TPA: DMT family transporter [Pseudonocardia sp.]|uniref:DMT family transporter n=1 Tax=Pseudonocardia sp. TaxID=60912 RepID=UPI002ED7EA4E
MGALLALASALSYGLSDFVGGLLSRRASFVRVSLFGQVGGLLTMMLAAPLVSRAVPPLADLAWGGLSGVGTGIGMTFLFRGMSRGAMSVVVPVSAVGGVVLPVLVGTALLGDRPAPLAWLGIAVAVPALWSVSRARATSAAPAGPALTDGLVSSVGIAVQYLALAQAGPEGGLWPVAAGRITSVITALALSTVLAASGPGQATDRATSDRSTSDRVTSDTGLGLWWPPLGGGFAGVLAGVALACYLVAIRTELVAVAVVLSSLYPVIPVLLGVTVLGERLSWRQTAGLVGALAASVLISTA